MDDLVAAALVKWPNVPHCHGWLGLDMRGNWYLRDEGAQAAGEFPAVKGSLIEHRGLREFIERNYASDAAGCCMSSFRKLKPFTIETQMRRLAVVQELIFTRDWTRCSCSKVLIMQSGRLSGFRFRMLSASARPRRAKAWWPYPNPMK